MHLSSRVQKGGGPCTDVRSPEWPKGKKYEEGEGRREGGILAINGQEGGRRGKKKRRSLLIGVRRSEFPVAAKRRCTAHTLISSGAPGV